jgi:hypothetical protein
MTKSELQAQLMEADKKGQLLTPKHDPNNNTPMKYYRSVLSYELACNLYNFLTSGDFEVTEYEKIGSNHPSPYYEILPTNSTFSVPSSGIAPMSPIPTIALDRVIAVSGANSGWHLFGEDSNRIQNEIATNKMKFVGKII